MLEALLPHPQHTHLGRHSHAVPGATGLPEFYQQVALSNGPWYSVLPLPGTWRKSITPEDTQCLTLNSGQTHPRLKAPLSHYPPAENFEICCHCLFSSQGLFLGLSRPQYSQSGNGEELTLNFTQSEKQRQ